MQTGVLFASEEAFIPQITCLLIFMSAVICLMWKLLWGFPVWTISSHGSSSVPRSPGAEDGKIKTLAMRRHAHHQKRRKVFTSASTHRSSYMKWAKTSCSLSESSVTSSRDFRSIRGHQSSNVSEETCQDDSNTSSESDQSNDEDKTLDLLEMINMLESLQETIAVRQCKRMALRTEKEGKTIQNTSTQPTEFTTVKIPFVDEPMVARLEAHLTTKRVQHLMGLPSALLNSLRFFMPSAPSFPPKRSKHEVHVVPKPEPLFFLSVHTREKLEHHLNKLLRQKRWKRPQQFQEALRGMKPPFPSLPVVHQPRSEDTGEAAKMQRSARSPPTTTEVLDNKTTPESKAKLQYNLNKKCLQVRLESLPVIVCSSKKGICGERRNWPLPKLIPRGHLSVQPRKGLCLNLLGRGDVVEMNIRCKLLHFLWDLPTLYMQSVYMLCSNGPALPISHFQVPSFINRGRVEPSFLPLHDRRCLESHVLTRRLQHQWSLPGLVQQSLNEFLFPAPSVLGHQSAKFHSRLEIQIFIVMGSFSFISTETKQSLERHLKRRIVQRQWGIPKRVFQSLQACLPGAPPLKRSHKETVASVPKRGNHKTMPSTMSQRSCKRSAGCSGNYCPEPSWDQKRKQLQRHLAKKTLEIHLGTVPPRVLQSYQISSHATKKKLPKGLPPGLRPPTPRPPHLPFVDQDSLARIQLSITLKNLMRRWGMPTILNKSIAQLHHDVAPPAPTNHPRNKPAMCAFSENETPFLAQKSRESLEWHVKKKAIQHTWGLPGIIQKSIQHLLPRAPLHCLQNRRYTDVAVCPATLSFLRYATQRELERNMQKRLIHHQWLLPKRVLAVNRQLNPKYGLGPREAEKTWSMGALYQKQRVKKTQRKGPRATPQIAIRSPTNSWIMLQHHLEKKCLEILTEALPMTIRASWSCTSSFERQPLPKMIFPGHRPLLPRRLFLPLAYRQDIERIEMTVKRNHLASFWELGTRYVEAIQGMTLKALSQPFQPRGRISVDLDAYEKLLPDADRQTLEHHVLKKKVGHAWGLPNTVQSSLQSFVGKPPSLPFAKKGEVFVDTQVQELFFLPREVHSHLELHLQKLKLHRLWGLPGRVIESLRMLHPEFKTGKPKHSALLGKKMILNQDGQRRDAAVNVLEKRKGSHLPITLKSPTVEAKYLGRIQLHLNKKSLEMHLDVLPRIFRLSNQHAAFSFRQPLPKLIASGIQPLKPRTASLFLGPQETNEIDLAMCRNRIACLWGLGTRYVGALGRMAPRVPFSPLQRSACDFSETSTPFLCGQTRESLERHIQKKRMHHWWGYSALVQSSVQSFMSEASTLSSLCKTMIEIQVLPPELFFLPESLRVHLEFHLQKIKLQRRWGLPGRVVESLKCFLPSFPSRKELRPTEFSTKAAKTSSGREVHTLCAAPKKKDDLIHHLCIKSQQIKLPALPSLLTCSQRELRSREMKSLPKLIHVGQKSPLSRNASMFFLPPATKDVVEMNVKHKNLAYLWELPKKYGVVHERYSSIQFHQKNVQFQQLKICFLQKQARELLEHHIQRKRLHHFWGIPSLIQRSLKLLIHPSPMCTHFRKGRIQEVIIQAQDLSFLPNHLQNNLERSLKNMIIHAQWGLPIKLHEILQHLLPSPPKKEEVQEESSMVESTLVYGPKVKKAEYLTGSQKAMDVDTPQAKKSFNTPSKQFPETRSPKPSKKSALESQSICDQSARGHVQGNVECFPQWRGSVERDTKWHHALLAQGRQDAQPVPVGRHQDQTIPNGREIPKTRFPQEEMGTVQLTKETWDLMESHIRRKRFQHVWGVPRIVQKSLLAFTPQPPESWTTKAMMPVACIRANGIRGRKKQHGDVQLPRSWLDGIVPHQLLKFLSTEVWDFLESHVKSWAAEHKWGLPKHIHDSLRASAPSRLKGSFTHRERYRRIKEQLSKLYHQQHHKCATQLHSNGKAVEKHPKVWKRTKEKSKKTISLGKQGTATQACPQKTAFLSPVASVPFLTQESQKTLEFHILHKRIQHAWGLPSTVLKCLSAFSLSPPDPEKHTVERMGRMYPQEGGRVQTTAQKLSSLMPDAKERLEAHVRSMATKHRWEIPKRVQLSLRGLRAPRQLSQDRADFPTPTKERKGKKQRSAFLPSGCQLAFLTNEATANLESHLQQKKIHHLWGLPLAVLKSLHAFDPHLSDGRKGMPSPGPRVVRKCPWEVQTIVWHLSFFNMKAKDDLEAHLRRRMAQHRWGLPKLVLQSLGVFLPPRATSKSELQQMLPQLPSPWKSFQDSLDPWQSKDDDSEVPLEKDQTCREEGEPEEMLQLEDQTTSSPTTIKSCSFLPVEVDLPFFTVESRSNLEFHIQQKKMEHGWRLPSIVTKSLLAFALLPLGAQKHTQSRKKPLGSTAGVQTVTGRMSILSPKVEQHLETHVGHVVAKHRWDLPKRVQQSLKAFRPPHTLSQTNLAQAQLYRTHLRAETQSQKEGDLDQEMSDAHLQTEKASISGSEQEMHVYSSEQFPDVIQDREMVSWQIMEEPSFCSFTRAQHSRSILEEIWKDGRKGSQRPALEKKLVLKKTMPIQRCMVAHEVEPGTPFLSLSSLGRRRSQNNSIPWPDTPNGFQRKRYLSGKSMQKSKGRKSRPCSSKISLQKKKKKTQWQLEHTFQTQAADSRPSWRQKESKAMEDSDTSWESMESSRVFKGPCTCYSSSSRASSVFSRQSVASQRRNQEANIEAKYPQGTSSFSKKSGTHSLDSAKQEEGGTSSFPSEENRHCNSDSNYLSSPPSGDKEALHSGSSKGLEEGLGSLLSEGNGFGNCGSEEMESSFSSLPSQHEEVHLSSLSSTANKVQRCVSSHLSKDSESHSSHSSLIEGQTKQENSEVAFQLFKEDMERQYNAFIYEEVWDSSLQPCHVVESNSSYEDTVARHYSQRRRQQKAKLGSRLQRKGSQLDWRINSCKSLGDGAAENDQEPSIKHDFGERSGASRGGAVHKTQRGGPEQPKGEKHQPHSVEQVDAQERMSIIRSILERKLHLQDGLERWQQNGGISKLDCWQKHVDFYKERNLTTAVQESGILANGHSGQGDALGGAPKITLKSCDHPTANRKKEKTINQEAEKTSREQYKWKRALIKLGLSHGCRTTRDGELPSSKETKATGHCKEHHQPQEFESVDGTQRTSILRKIKTKLRLFAGLKLWNRKSFLFWKDKTQRSRASLSTQGTATSDTPKASGVQGAGLEGAKPKERKKSEI